ncbi:hypothetical protein OC846_002892 [Tilletia horrida]|uniref:DUF2423 domain-containing protein n=1 Tax=Tilletia horrida TaxID=155126 RepID=A0AAN6GQ10_9BASI|nr:hypothetical protein OC845_002086 [Tilletia horrida]KAK0552488.1 hypothetical protein OC846_002892 [Tilletia horrida]KAK0561784.1 hypothetical protein OC861_005650 [Tilletia horrida]
MAKSLRSKSKVAARRVKRTDPNSVYKINADQRIQRAAARLKVLAKGPKVSAQQSESAEDQEDDQDASSSALMDQDEGEDATEGGEPTKISTSGSRGSRRETWRAARGWKPRVGSKNGGRTKRRH